MSYKITATKGPWKKRAVTVSDEFGKVTIIGFRGVHVAEVWNGGTRDPKVADANANLIINAVNALDRIHAQLDGKEWSSDTADAIAEILQSVGYKIREPR